MMRKLYRLQRECKYRQQNADARHRASAVRPMPLPHGPRLYSVGRLYSTALTTVPVHGSDF